MATEMKRLKVVLKKHGLEYRQNKNHGAIHRISDGVRVASASASPSDPYWWRSCIRDLIKRKIIPAGKYW